MTLITVGDVAVVVRGKTAAPTMHQCCKTMARDRNKSFHLTTLKHHFFCLFFHLWIKCCCSIILKTHETLRRAKHFKWIFSIAGLKFWRGELNFTVRSRWLKKEGHSWVGEVISQKPFHYGRRLWCCSLHITLSPTDLLKLTWSQPEALRAELQEEKKKTAVTQLFVHLFHQTFVQERNGESKGFSSSSTNHAWDCWDLSGTGNWRLSGWYKYHTLACLHTRTHSHMHMHTHTVFRCEAAARWDQTVSHAAL